MSFTRTLGLLFVALLPFPAACGEDSEGGGKTDDTPDARGNELTGQACENVSECFQGLADGGVLQGEPVCLDRVEDGYCTHECVADTDCCAVPGECVTDLPQVCSPFESDDRKLCFLSCEDDDIRAHEHELFGDGGDIDANLFCQRRAGTGFICRSTGGGSQNRKVCVPGGTNIGDAGAD